MTDRLRQIPPWAWVVLAAVAGVVALTYHSYAQDDQDTDWTTPKEQQAPAVASFPIAPGQTGTGSPMSVNAAFRSRAFPASLISADFSIIGEA